MTRVIVNADDFGRSPAVNEAVLLAHRRGVLTSASLMVTGSAFEEAVAIARRSPDLAVGLHLVLADGRSALPPEAVPHLVDADGRLRRTATNAGLLYSLSVLARRELAREIAAQFERFSDAGLELSHVDGHLHLHLHPAVLDLVLAQARRHGARGFRVPRDDRGLAKACGGTRLKWAEALALDVLSRRARARLRQTRFAVPSRVYGLYRSGRMDEATLVRVLARVSAPTAEIYLHPSTVFEDDLGPNPGDLHALVSPLVRRVLGERRHQLSTYPRVAGA